MTMVKICGITRSEDVQALNHALPDYAGFIIGYPKSRRNITAERARLLRSLLSERIKTVGVFVDNDAREIAELAENGVIDVIQLHGNEDDDYVARLRKMCDKPIWKSFIVRSDDDIERAKRSTADMILLDGGMGGGEGFDHTLLSDIGRDYILAGGLDASNIPEVIRTLEPWAVDVSSGAETQGAKDREKIEEIVRCARAGVNRMTDK